MNRTEQTRTTWDGVAEGYDTYVTPLVIPLAEEVLGRVNIRAGTRLLDVAAGSGALALAGPTRRPRGRYRHSPGHECAARGSRRR